MPKYGFVRVAAAVPEMKVADCVFNTAKILELMAEAANKQCYITVFPELCITGYTCGDLFRQSVLLDSALDSLHELTEASRKWDNVFIVGLPLLIKNRLYNCAAVIQKGQIKGIVPKSCIPNNNEFYEKRWFREGGDLDTDCVSIFGENIPCGVDLIFHDAEYPQLCFAVEICEDMWIPVPPSSKKALDGALIICNLSASNELVGKHEYREMLVKSQSGRCIAGYLYSSSGVGESTTDLVFGGHAIIAENGIVLAQSERFRMESQLVVSEIDIQRLVHDRMNKSTFMPSDADNRVVTLEPWKHDIETLNREIEKHPFVPSNPKTCDERCAEIFKIQSAGLIKRIKHTGIKKAVIGISGGLDSTLAFLVTMRAFDQLQLPRENIIAVTMPGFGTTDQTYRNAVELINIIGADYREISIKDACINHLRDIGHDPSEHDSTYENAQARERTQILMDLANKENGLVIGTGDLSELALGWCTYNGDHMSMYSVNYSIPKTLVKHLVRWVSNNTGNNDMVGILRRILDMPVTPELLPAENGEIVQKTEDIIGPYELHDFFIYHMIRYGADPDKILFLAKSAFHGEYDEKQILSVLKIFYKRFFSQQFKRSCMPDGPKVGTISLSPRGDWRMPSDASAQIWLKWAENT
ncbi:MAG TPA: NAD(+) synthase [Ruminiclostridium sp.]|jgi:NAD+ synthase (glutamine-hydrolysing)|nr:NAD(+) synthase [Clostridiaceae bacterium]HAA25489.1 NAD(+) synthase [Ruminiclostridium sp.]